MNSASAPAPVTVRNVALGADHGGFELKEIIKKQLQAGGWTVADFGAKSKEPTDDYPDFALAVAHSVAEHKNDAGVLVCTSGVGMSITANKVPGVRAALVSDPETAALSRRHNNANVLSLGARYFTEESMMEAVNKWLNTPFSEDERHIRRLAKIDEIPIVEQSSLRDK